MVVVVVKIKLRCYIALHLCYRLLPSAALDSMLHFLSRRTSTGVMQTLDHVLGPNLVVRTLKAVVTDCAIIMDTLVVGTFVRSGCFMTAHKIGV